MKTVTINLFKFEELSEEAQQNAVQKWRETDTDYFWSRDNQASLKGFTDMFPIEVKDFSYDSWSHNESVLYAGESDYQTLSGTRLLKHLLNQYYTVLFERKTFTLSSGKKRKSRIITQETCCPFTGYCMDEELLKPIRDFIKKPNNTDFEDLLSECVSAWGKACQADCHYQQTDEYIKETIIANEYDFTEEGEMY